MRLVCRLEFKLTIHEIEIAPLFIHKLGIKTQKGNALEPTNIKS